MTGRPQAVLVDGYNVLHAVPRFAPRGSELGTARSVFETWLSQAARREGIGEIVVVWDGSRGSCSTRATGLTVLHTPAGVSADERLLELCRRSYAARAASTWVVSSDRGVQAPARQLGFTVLGAMTFYDRWSRRRGGGEAVCAEEDKPRPTRAEVESLLAEFETRRDHAEPEDRD